MARTRHTALNKALVRCARQVRAENLARDAIALGMHMPTEDDGKPLSDSQKCAELQRRVGALRRSTSDQLRVRLLALVSVALDWAAKIEGAE
jgi:hypothetical protein